MSMTYLVVGFLSAVNIAMLAWLRSQDLEESGIWHHDNWRRCENCRGQLVRTTDESLVKHIGHRLRPVAAVNASDYAKILLGGL